MRVLVAGLGNIFLGDDGFGVEVARLLCRVPLPDGVRVEDYGIRSLHLAYELTGGGYDLTVLVDAAHRGGRPGSLYVIEPDLDAVPPATAADAHTMTPDAIFASIRALGGAPGPALLVGCEPETVEERMGLSPPVAQAAVEAVRLVRELLERECERERNVSGDTGANRAVVT
jgi:hydrogenase maturation protease